MWYKIIFGLSSSSYTVQQKLLKVWRDYFARLKYLRTSYYFLSVSSELDVFNFQVIGP